MKTFQHLTDKQQEGARNHELTELLRATIEGGIRFDDRKNGDNLQARIDKAVAQAEAMRTPWFAHEYILDTCREDLEGIAVVQAQDALYREPDEYVSRFRLD